jgi:hypothetical protein
VVYIEVGRGVPPMALTEPEQLETTLNIPGGQGGGSPS